MTTRRTSFGVVVKKSSIDGHGVFAAKNFDAGEVIGVISGYIPEETDPECRYTCEFEDDYGNWYALEPTYPFRYLNHSSTPNADIPSPVLVALDDIEAGDEITISYGEEWEKEDADESD